MNDSLNDARTTHGTLTEGSPQEHGTWNRDQGTGVVGPEAPSIVTAVDARRAELRDHVIAALRRGAHNTRALDQSRFEAQADEVLTIIDGLS